MVARQQAAGITAQQDGSVATARKLFRHAAQLATDQQAHGACNVFMKWATFEEGQGHLADAEQLLSRGLAAAPGPTHQASVQMAWAEFSARRGDVDQALEQASAAMALASRSGAMANRAAKLQRQLGATDLARDSLLLALDLGFQEPAVFQTLGLVEWQAGRLPDARRAFWQGTKRFPGYSSLWSAWGKVEASCSNIGRARSLFERSLQADPGNMRARLGLTALESRAGRSSRAGALYEGAQEWQGDNVPLLHARAQELRRQGNQEAAADMLTRVLELDSTNAFAWHTLGQMHEEQGRHAEALASYGSGCRCTGSKAVLQNFQGLANMHAFLGQHDHARAIYEQGRQIYPQTSRFLRAFALFEKRQGRLQAGSQLPRPTPSA
eukprot:jgi/Astpho2/5368/Aster-x0679